MRCVFQTFLSGWRDYDADGGYGRDAQSLYSSYGSFGDGLGPRAGGELEVRGPPARPDIQHAAQPTFEPFSEDAHLAGALAATLVHTLLLREVDGCRLHVECI